MADNPTPRKGDVNTIVKLKMNEDLSGASSLKVDYLKSDLKTTGQLTGSYSGSNNEYLVVTMPLWDMGGDWILAPYAENLGSWSGHGDPVTIHVYGIYEVVD